MLQQTTVQAVTGFYTRWMARFPSWSALAEAEEEEVLRLWEGLGYYRRARNLHHLARKVHEEFGGVLPESVAALRRLPGIGPYTAAAILAFAYDQREPALDANIARVMARLMDDATPIDSVNGRRRLEGHMEVLLGKRQGMGVRGGRVLVGGLMEIGALVCSPARPRCGQCPLERFCQADDPERLPVRRPRPAIEDRSDERLWIEEGAKIFLIPSKGPLWRGLWLLPEAVDQPSRGRMVLCQSVYTITRYRVRLCVYASQAVPSEGEGRWFGRGELAKLPMPAPYRKVVRRMLSQERLALVARPE